ncbi:ABC transporter permease [Spiroplasma gladiatoris]|uniref:ABC transporter permease n=1 Tax=Spiroplasma gladiatoris TaxID=2143 RepID=A0A4P7AKE0_9MOLU|nr:ABC transporter permease [Spiroplasma gladiatoris]QBQ08030.1 ABC transporter permease [Spiroplasma gladiatoris]
MKTTKTKNSFNLKNKSKIAFQLFRLISKSFYKNFRGPIFTYVVPVFFTIIFYYLFSSDLVVNKGSAILGYVVLPCLTTIINLSGSIVEWKNSIFLKRMETTGISRKTFILTIWLFYFLVGFSGVCLELIIGLIIGGNDVIELYKNMNWGFFILAVSLICLMSIGLATLLGGNLNDEGANQGIALMIYFLCIFFSGVMLDPRLYESTTALRIFTYFIPLKYPVFLLLFSQYSDGDWKNAGFNNGIWDNRQNPEPLYQNFTSTWQPIVGAILIIGLLFLISTLTFKWHRKN